MNIDATYKRAPSGLLSDDEEDEELDAEAETVDEEDDGPKVNGTDEDMSQKLDEGTQSAQIHKVDVSSDKLSTLRRLVTVEVILFLYFFGENLIRPTIDALVYRKVCASHFDIAVCDHLGNSSHQLQEDRVQKETSHWYLAENLVYEIPSILLSFYYGSVSDNVSRKAALLLPAIGQSLSALNYVINSIWIELPVYYILIGPLMSGIFGGWVSCGMASFSYLSDVTSAESRTKRIAIAECLLLIARAIAAFISGKLLDMTSYTFVTSLGLAMFCFMALYTLVWIKDPPSAKRIRNNRTWSTMCNALCNRTQIKDAITCVFRKREDNGRMHVLMCLALLLINKSAAWAEMAVGYLYLRRRPLLWTQTLYGYFFGCCALLGAIGQLGIPVLRDKVGLRETTCLIISYVSFILFFGILSVSFHTWTGFLAPLFGMFAHTPGLTLRSMLSRMVETDELGRMFATFGALQSISGLIGSCLYNSIYPRTLSWWPGFCFDLAAGLMLVPISLSIVLAKDLKKYNWGVTMPVVDVKEEQEHLLQCELDASLYDRTSNVSIGNGVIGETMELRARSGEDDIVADSSDRCHHPLLQKSENHP